MSLQGSVLETLLHKLTDEDLLLLVQVPLRVFVLLVLRKKLVSKFDNSAVHCLQLKNLRLNCPGLLLGIGKLLEFIIDLLGHLLDCNFLSLLLSLGFGNGDHDESILRVKLYSIFFQLLGLASNVVVGSCNLFQVLLLVGEVFLELSQFGIQLVLLLDLTGLFRFQLCFLSLQLIDLILQMRYALSQTFVLFLDSDRFLADFLLLAGALRNLAVQLLSLLLQPIETLIELFVLGLLLFDSFGAVSQLSSSCRDKLLDLFNLGLQEVLLV